MFGLGKQKQPDATPDAPADRPNKGGLFGRLKAGLRRTNEILNTDIRDLVARKRAIDDEVLEELETRLLLADVGVDATRRLLEPIYEQVRRRQLQDVDQLHAALREAMVALLAPVAQPLTIETTANPYVILVVGINGAGKTTTIGKLARRLQQQGHSVLLAAGDTFRAAAVEQLQRWGERNEVPVIAQQSGADAAAVVHDALQAAQARHCDVLIADTAGRLHTQAGLMQELQKVKRVLGRLDATAPHEVLLVLDAGNGQNALVQAQQFHQAVAVSGIALTKLDGTAKGGIIFAIAERLGLPVRFVGVGEGVEDLQPFDATTFVDALLSSDEPAVTDGNAAPRTSE